MTGSKFLLASKYWDSTGADFMLVFVNVWREVPNLQIWSRLSPDTAFFTLSLYFNLQLALLTTKLDPMS